MSALLSVLILSCGCENTPGSMFMPIPLDRNTIWNDPSILGEFEVLSDAPWEVHPPNSTDVLRGHAFRVRVLRYLPSRHTSPMLHPSIGSEIRIVRTMSNIPYLFDGGPATARLPPGLRLLILASGYSFRSDVEPYLHLTLACSIDPTQGLLLEPCVSFPAGTPLTRILDDTWPRYCAGLPIDGGLPPDAPSCPPTPDVPPTGADRVPIDASFD